MIIKLNNREDWLAARQHQGIGGSEAGSVLGVNKYQNNVELWELKTGRAKPKDLSDNEAVQRGIRMEGALRGWFAACHPEFEIVHKPYDMIFQEDRPWLYATLDGEFFHRETGERGVLEIKTAAPRGNWAEWDGQVPAMYYDQILHQYLATGAKWFFLVAGLWKQNGDVIIREYEWKADEAFLADAGWLLLSEENFWDHVRRNTRPPEPIKL